VKKICLFLIAIYLLLCINVGAQDISNHVEVEENIRIGSPEFSQSQGDNGWYFCQYASGTVSELIWSDEIKGWKSSEGEAPKIKNAEMLPSTTKDLDFKFVPNKYGLYRLSWDIAWKFKSGTAADGMTISVIKNNETLWQKSVELTKPTDCSVAVILNEGDEVHFRANCNAQPWYDSFTGYPMVELIGAFYQKNDSGIKEISWDDNNKCYMADDKLARISLDAVMPTEEYSLMRRYIFPSNGRFRVFGKVSSKNKTGGGNVLKIYKNDKLVKEQLCLCAEDTLIDVRMLCDEKDILDIEMGILEYEGFNYSTWDIDIESISGTVRDCEATTTNGYICETLSSKKLSAYISDLDKNGTKIYTIVNGIKYPMVYDATAKQWEETSKDIGAITKIPKSPRETTEEYANTVLNDAGYVQSTKVSATKNWTPGSATLIEIPVEQDGCLLIDGEFSMASSTDGELVKVYVNDKFLWSNRIGGEVSTRFDEHYDTKYFINNIHAVANVKKGYVLSFIFNKWRLGVAGETVDISDINLRYIEGDVLSETTKWKLENSVVVDTATGSVSAYGQGVSYDAYIENDTTYISAGTAQELFGYVDATNTNSDVALRTAVENTGNTVVWAEDKLAIVHPGIPGMYTWNELSEIKTQSELKGGVLYE